MGVQSILNKRYMIHEYFGNGINNLKTGSYLEIILHTTWQKEVAEFFFYNGVEYLGQPNIYEFAFTEANNHMLFIVRRIN